MEADECDYYELKKNKTVCSHFIGNVLSDREISFCKKHCSYYDCMGLMQGEDRQPVFRHKGALRQARNK